MQLYAPPPQVCQPKKTSLLGIDYLHLKTADDSDLYLTRFGSSLYDHLHPANWHAPAWFASKRTRLPGTSTIYRLPTRPIAGRALNLVARFSRVGEPVPFDTLTLHKNIHAEFNSPFEEFALVMELRSTSAAPGRPRVLTKKPLAIYSPALRLEPWQTGRLESKIAAKHARHPTVDLDIQRQYILLYGWINGVTAVQAAGSLQLDGASRENFLRDITLRAIRDLEQSGFRMLDIKPQHIILRLLSDGSLLRTKDGALAYALVDYELLERLPGNIPKAAQDTFISSPQ
jgi:hypothetical protein